MARFEVYAIDNQGRERIVTRTRRENGAIAERDIAADSEYAVSRKHAEVGGRVAYGPTENPGEVAVIFMVDADTTRVSKFGYRRVVRENALAEALTFSLAMLA